MIRRDLVFSTSQFNFSEVLPNFINPNCFGEDLIGWLRRELEKNSIKSTPPVQEDWGWYSECTIGTQHYFMGVSGKPAEDPKLKNKGEWRVILQKGRSFIQRVKGTSRMAPDDPVLTLLSRIIEQLPDFENPRIE